VWFSVFNRISDLQPAIPLPPPSSPWPGTHSPKKAFSRLTRHRPLIIILAVEYHQLAEKKKPPEATKVDIKSQLPIPNANSTLKTWILPSNPTMFLVSVAAVFAEIFHANPGTSCIDFWCVSCLMMFNLPQLSDTSSTIEYNLCSCIVATTIGHHMGSCSLRYWMVPAKFHGSRFSLWYYFLFEQSFFPLQCTVKHATTKCLRSRWWSVETDIHNTIYSTVLPLWRGLPVLPPEFLLVKQT
jgi:hypothetical protein